MKNKTKLDKLRRLGYEISFSLKYGIIATKGKTYYSAINVDSLYTIITGKV